MKKVSRRAILMWFVGALYTKAFIIVVVLFILSGGAFFYLAGMTTQQILFFGAVYLWPYVRLVDFLVFAGLGVAMLFFVLKAVMGALTKHLSVEYELGPEALKIVTGIFAKEEIYIPYKSVQSVDIKVSGSEYLWGLADVLIFISVGGNTNNPESAAGFIEGLRYKDAVALKDELFKRVK